MDGVIVQDEQEKVNGMFAVNLLTYIFSGGNKAPLQETTHADAFPQNPIFERLIQDAVKDLTGARATAFQHPGTSNLSSSENPLFGGPSHSPVPLNFLGQVPVDAAVQQTVHAKNMDEQGFLFQIQEPVPLSVTWQGQPLQVAITQAQLVPGKQVSENFNPPPSEDAVKYPIAYLVVSLEALVQPESISEQSHFLRSALEVTPEPKGREEIPHQLFGKMLIPIRVIQGEMQWGDSNRGIPAPTSPSSATFRVEVGDGEWLPYSGGMISEQNSDKTDLLYGGTREKTKANATLTIKPELMTSPNFASNLGDSSTPHRGQVSTKTAFSAPVSNLLQKSGVLVSDGENSAESAKTGRNANISNTTAPFPSVPEKTAKDAGHGRTKEPGKGVKIDFSSKPMTVKVPLNTLQQNMSSESSTAGFQTQQKETSRIYLDKSGASVSTRYPFTHSNSGKKPLIAQNSEKGNGNLPRPFEFPIPMENEPTTRNNSAKVQWGAREDRTVIRLIRHMLQVINTTGGAAGYPGNTEIPQGKPMSSVSYSIPLSPENLSKAGDSFSQVLFSPENSQPSAQTAPGQVVGTQLLSENKPGGDGQPILAYLQSIVSAGETEQPVKPEVLATGIVRSFIPGENLLYSSPDSQNAEAVVASAKLVVTENATRKSRPHSEAGRQNFGQESGDEMFVSKNARSHFQPKTVNYTPVAHRTGADSSENPVTRQAESFSTKEYTAEHRPPVGKTVKLNPTPSAMGTSVQEGVPEQFFTRSPMALNSTVLQTGTGQQVGHFSPSTPAMPAMARLDEVMEMITRWTEQMRFRSTVKEQEITIQLRPATLGSVRMLLSMKENKLRARIETQRPEAAAAIHQSSHQLISRLEEMNIQVQQFDVHTSSEFSPFHARQEEGQNPFGKGRASQQGVTAETNSTGRTERQPRWVGYNTIDYIA